MLFACIGGTGLINEQGLQRRNVLEFFLDYVYNAITRVQVNQDGLKLNGTHQLLAYADDVNILGKAYIQ